MKNKFRYTITFSSKLIFVVMMIFAASLSAYSVMDAKIGNQVTPLDARTAAMGDASTGFSANLFGSLYNPANLNNLPGKAGFQFAAGFMRHAQQRSLPMYDSFDGFVGDAEYVANENIFGEMAVGAYYKFSYQPLDFAVAAQYRPHTNFDCRYDEEIRNNENADFNSYPPIIATNIIDGEGSINAMSFLTSINYDKYTLGIELASLSGEQDYSKKVLWSDYADAASTGTLQDSIIALTRDFEGFTYQIGLQAEINRYTSVGFNYKPELDIDAKAYGITDSYKQPGSMRLGLYHAPRSFISSSINLDVEYVNWNSINDLYDNELNYYIGVEHVINKNMPFRMGFNYKTDYQMTEDDGIEYADKIIVPTFSAGTGFQILDNFTLDLSIAYSNRIYEALDLFQDTVYDHEVLWNNYTYMNFEYRGWENPDKVTETNFKLQTTLSYKF